MAQSKLRMTKMTLPPLTEKEPDPKRASQADNHMDEEVTNLDQDPGEE